MSPQYLALALALVLLKFHSLPEHKGILETHVREKEVYLPVVTLNKDSDVIIRNLFAYESLTSNTNELPLANFMVLMCALVVNVNDVKSLNYIIKGDLPADEVVKLFTGMSSSILAMNTTEESYIQKIIDDINRVYNSRRRMKPYLFLKKLALWLLVGLKAIGGFVESSWKIVAFILSLVSVLTLSAQAYCEILCGLGPEGIPLAEFYVGLRLDLGRTMSWAEGLGINRLSNWMWAEMATWAV
ncbi:hypothetical protein R6Q59_013243 [Mikania micrantha]